MPTIRITFLKCEVNSQEFASDDEHMVSRVFFTLEVNGRELTGLHCDVKQIVGAKFESDNPLEVGPPDLASYPGPFNHQAFSLEVERYYRELAGAHGSLFRVAPGARNIQLMGVTLRLTKVVEFEASGSSGAW